MQYSNYGLILRQWKVKTDVHFSNCCYHDLFISIKYDESPAETGAACELYRCTKEQQSLDRKTVKVGS